MAELYIVSSTESDTRERILQETLRLMEKKQGKGVRVEDIARAAEVSRQAVYLHFGSRGGLLTETARYLDSQAQHWPRSEGIRSASSGVEALEALIVFWASYIPDIYGLAKALMLLREHDKDAALAWNDRMAAFYEKCSMVTRRLEQEGCLAPGWSVEEASDFLWTLLAISNWEHLTIERGWSQEQYLAQMRRVSRLLLVEASPGQSRKQKKG